MPGGMVDLARVYRESVQAEPDTPRTVGERLKGALDATIAGAIVTVLGFFDDVTIGPIVIGLSAVLPALVTFVGTAVGYSFVQYGASEWLIRHWNGWIQGENGQRFEARLRKWRHGRLTRRAVEGVEKGSILSVGGEVSAPTGDKTLGTGGESTVFELFAAYGQILPADSFLQVQAGVELPTNRDAVSRAWYLRTAIGKTFSTDGGFGRRWSPMVEVIGDRDLVSGASTNWDVALEMQIPISKRMHILGSVGYRIPVNNTADRPKQVMFYLLWDFPDGSLTEGW